MQQALKFIQEFEMSKIEVIPILRGQLYSMSVFPKDSGKQERKPSLKYFVLDPVQGDIICFRKEADY
jgi:hypothetical protein